MVQASTLKQERAGYESYLLGLFGVKEVTFVVSLAFCLEHTSTQQILAVNY